MIETDRTLIRDWRADEADRFFDIYSRWEVARWLGATPAAMTDRAEADRRIERWRALNEESPVEGRWAVERRADGVVAGTVILVRLPEGDGELEVGWHLHPDSWGQGLAGEAARAVLGHAFDRGVDEVFAVVRPDNAPPSRSAGGSAWNRWDAPTATTARSSSSSGSTPRCTVIAAQADNLEGMRRWVGFLRTTPCLVLLLVQLGGVVLYPFMADSFAGRAAYSVFGIIVLMLTIVALRATPFFTWVSGLVFVPAAALLLLGAFTRNEQLFPWSAGFELVLYFYAGISMLAYMLKDEDVSVDELFAIPAVFTLFAWAFTYLFVVVQALDPHAFGGQRGWMDLLFLSFTTLSSTGLSDIVPVTGHARSVVMLEQVAGVFYIAMVVTRLVSLRADRRRA